MATPNAGEEKGGSNWQRLWQQRKKWYLLYMPVGGLLMFVAGVIFWGGFNTALEATNTEEFCISCHEMRDNVYQEYKETIHYKNPAGVRAGLHHPGPAAGDLWRSGSGLETERSRHGYRRDHARGDHRTGCAGKPVALHHATGSKTEQTRG